MTDDNAASVRAGRRAAGQGEGAAPFGSSLNVAVAGSLVLYRLAGLL